MSDALRLILFDVDGTLADSQGAITSAMAAAFAGAGLPSPSRAEILSIVGLSLPLAMAELAGEQPADVQAVLVEGYKSAYKSARLAAGAGHSPLYPGAAEVLAELNAVPEYLLGVATGKSQRGLDALIEAHELRCFVTRQCADHHPSKPHPSMVLRAMAETGVRPEDTVMIGDTSFDIDMGRAAGVRTIAVDWGFHPAERLGADHIIKSFGELAPLLRNTW
ncbi:HAD-IA family hydrolase [Phaeobacter italicus]|jgi:phosphoglycolate phosphatase|uniref:HAD-IA family hydrolase n=1 Tax=Phaeobacter italicus TaxID=481446 RepID=UPI0006194B7F|nr:HAD-IA family hydrolase [Phaeobacter italicus]MEE2817825.1 HAD-IA family hydrolase [Pseudomonadota bacterium]MBO9442559.1 HAD-IA family hydrolase [Phaeobacter italicus]MCA0858008.1 HAD-IA family hydrolase [Phaeobacter italicus]MCI5098882.1 HAD-IA family hydrolase [Phaeobacter italicus]GLO73217.1 haloacid dehalogenase [Phaeobacter italicus]